MPENQRLTQPLADPREAGERERADSVAKKRRGSLPAGHPAPQGSASGSDKTIFEAVPPASPGHPRA